MIKSFSKPFFANGVYPITSALMLALVTPNLVQAASTNQPINVSVKEGQQKITGKITSSLGPVSGATITVKENSALTTSSDQNGNFSVAATIGQTLVISAVGYETVEKKVAGGVVSVVLVESSEALEEVVIVGYGTQQKKESLTGALQTVSGEKLRDVTTPAVENMLNGKAAGVYVSPGGGKPGARGAVVIRGQATLSGTSSPLWVIDGVIVGSNPGDINPDDIASMTILKDAASTSIYGSQGANGVVVVTTKRPTAREATINFSSKLGFNNLHNGNMEMMNGAELYDYYKSFANPEKIDFPRWNEELRNSNFDWWKLATKTGFVQNHNVSLQGGTEKLQSLLSLGYYDEVGAVKGYGYDRYNVRINTVYKPFDWLTIKPSIVGARRAVEDRQYSTGAMYSNLPWDSPFDQDGNLVPHRYGGWVNSQNTNYLYDLQWNHSANTNYELMGNLDFEIKLTDWLTFSSINNYRYNSYGASEYTDPRSNSGLNVNGRIKDYRTEYARRYTTQILRANKTWGKHAVNGIVAYEFNDYWAKVLDVYGTGFIPGFQVLDVVSKPERTRGSINEWATQSYLSNANYAYDDRYLAQVSFRRDEASNFGKKFGNFYSISGGWNIHRESWFNAPWVNNLKLRAAYGTVGNRPSALYPQYSLYSVALSAGYNGLPGMLINQIGNEGLTWEETAITGFGVDAAFWDNRLRVNLDLYDKNTDNILYRVPISTVTGVRNVWKNIGEMNNRGFEVTVGGDIIRKKDWFWSLDINLGHNKNKLTGLYQTRQADGSYAFKHIIIGDDTNIAGSASRVLDIGLPVDTYYLKEWAGVNVENGAPMWYIVDRDGNGNEIGRKTTSNYAAATMEKLGKASADIFGGINTFLSYKQFDLAAVFGYSLGGKIYNYSRQEYDADGTYTDRNQMKLQDGWSRWEKPGDIATHPVARYENNMNGNKVSSRYLEDSDFLRLRSMTLGYNFNLERYKVKNLRVFFSGENIFTWTNYSGVDPEIPVKEDDGKILSSAGPSVYPTVRKFMFGVNVTF
ncbi:MULTISPECIES: SusC/RagA family TonB-linked outer membrane protein [Sphingobacterium]|uniref:SusC/RagA family TonB-linked outer membrane protein n=1 Tax=Sphingobacterium TaxID=28453 RepID=UPI00196A099B|nr:MULTISPECIES: SusC/RagA family TonB-linked outer membrane protein [unclassified Sphingobacterium]